MRFKTLVTFRSRYIGFDEEEMATDQMPAPESVWTPSAMTEERVQEMVDHGLLRPKAEVEWRGTAGEPFPSEDDKE